MDILKKTFLRTSEWDKPEVRVNFDMLMIIYQKIFLHFSV